MGRTKNVTGGWAGLGAFYVEEVVLSAREEDAWAMGKQGS